MHLEVVSEAQMPANKLVRMYVVRRQLVGEGIAKPFDVYWQGPDRLFGTTWGANLDEAAKYPTFRLALRMFVQQYRGSQEPPSPDGPVGVVPVWVKRRG